MEISKIFISILILALISGCAPIVLNIKDTPSVEVVKLNVDKVEIVNIATVEPWRNDPLSSRPNPLRQDVQTQFHEAINRNAVYALIAAGISSNKKVIIRIDRAVVMKTTQGIRNVPFLGLLLLGVEEEYSAFIEGAIEIEDDQKKVIDKADIRVSTTMKGHDATVEQIKEGASNVINEALISLQKEIIEKSKRYLHKHLL